MDRRDFLKFSGITLAGLSLPEILTKANGTANTAHNTANTSHNTANDKDSSYSIVLLGDTHFDAHPDTYYHEGYSDPNPDRDALHRKEFANYANMWDKRSPSIVKRAACLVDDDTRFILQLGDLIQGDTGSYESHVRMLGDAYAYLKEAFGPMAIATVVGNHDIRALDDNFAIKAYNDFMPKKLSEEFNQDITSVNYALRVGEDAYIFIDFNHPVDEDIFRLLKETEGARYTFIVMHGPIFPYDSPKYYNWFIHGRRHTDPAAWAAIREAFARRNAIVLCGHTHNTEFADWYGDGGHITQMTFNSVWKSKAQGFYTPLASTPEEYGTIAEAAMKESGKDPQKAEEYFKIIRPGLKAYSFAKAAGSYKMKVTPEGVTVDFYVGDEARRTKQFILR